MRYAAVLYPGPGMRYGEGLEAVRAYPGFEEDVEKQVEGLLRGTKTTLARVGEKQDEGLNLRPPEEGFELFRHKNAESTRTGGWSGLYWARKNEASDYEIRSVAREGEALSMTGGVFPKEGFEEHYEKVRPSWYSSRLLPTETRKDRV